MPVAIINPKSSRHFAELMLTNSKTDSVDAALLAEYAERMTPRLWTVPDDDHMALRDIGRQINRLTATRTQAKNRLHALKSKRATMKLLIDDELDGIHWLNPRIEKLSQAALSLIAQNEKLSNSLAYMRAAKIRDRNFSGTLFTPSAFKRTSSESFCGTGCALSSIWQ